MKQHYFYSIMVIFANFPSYSCGIWEAEPHIGCKQIFKDIISAYQRKAEKQYNQQMIARGIPLSKRPQAPQVILTAFNKID